MNGDFNGTTPPHLTRKERRERRKELIAQGKQSGDPAVRSAADRLDRNNVAMEKGKLAENVYSPKEAPEGWINISNDKAALDKYGLKPRDMKIEGTPSFRVQVYEPDPAVFGSDMKPAVVFQGTNPASMTDWQNNFAQGLNKQSDYYKRAVNIGTKVKKSGQSIDMVGHSLGGGMASAASRASGQMGWTFNSEGLNPNTVGRYGGTLHVPASENISAYRTLGEILTAIQEQGLQGTLVGMGAGAGIGALVGGVTGAGVGALVGGLAKIGLSALMPDAVGNKIPLEGEGINPVAPTASTSAASKSRRKKTRPLSTRQARHDPPLPSYQTAPGPTGRCTVRPFRMQERENTAPPKTSSAARNCGWPRPSSATTQRSQGPDSSWVHRT